MKKMTLVDCLEFCAICMPDIYDIGAITRICRLPAAQAARQLQAYAEDARRDMDAYLAEERASYAVTEARERAEMRAYLIRDAGAIVRHCFEQCAGDPGRAGAMLRDEWGGMIRHYNLENQFNEQYKKLRDELTK